MGGPMGTEGEKPLEVETIDLDVTIPAELPEDAVDVVLLDDEELSFPGDYPEAASTPKIECGFRPQASIVHAHLL